VALDEEATLPLDGETDSQFPPDSIDTVVEKVTAFLP
jgi:hypothetical protein